VNEETVIAIGSLIFFGYLAKACHILSPFHGCNCCTTQILCEPIMGEQASQAIKSVLNQPTQRTPKQEEHISSRTDLTKALSPPSKVNDTQHPG
jgi:hypothetical protein